MPAERAPTRTPNRTARTSAKARSTEARATEARSTEVPGTEAFSPRYRGIDGWDAADILQALFEGQLAAVAAIGPALNAIAAAATAAVPRLRRGGRLIYAGAGTSGRLAVLDGVELTPTFGWPQDRLGWLIAGGAPALTTPVEGAEDDKAGAERAVADAGLGADDVLIAVAASGGTPYTRRALAAAGKRGALTIAIANNADTPLFDGADHGILLATGPEAIAGSTRMKAGTAQKIALNLLSTLIMIRLGHVYDGLMVDVQAGNAKLAERSVRIVRAIAGVDAGPAAGALKQSDGNVKLAALVLRGLTPAAGRQLLDANDDDLRRAFSALDTRPA